MEGYELIDSESFNKLANNRYSRILQSFYFQSFFSYYLTITNGHPVFVQKAMDENYSNVIYENGALFGAQIKKTL